MAQNESGPGTVTPNPGAGAPAGSGNESFLSTAELAKELSEIKKILSETLARLEVIEKLLGKEKEVKVDWKAVWSKLRKGKNGSRWAPADELKDTGLVELLHQRGGRLETQKVVFELRRGSKGEFVVVKDKR